MMETSRCGTDVGHGTMVCGDSNAWIPAHTIMTVYDAKMENFMRVASMTDDDTVVGKEGQSQAARITSIAEANYDLIYFFANLFAELKRNEE